MEKVIEINGEVVANDLDNITFNNGYKIVLETHRDCCAGIFLYDVRKLFVVGEFIQKIKLSYNSKKQVFLRTFDKNNEEIYCGAFYHENNGYYAPWTNVVVYNEKNQVIFKEILDEENLSWED